MEFGGCGGGPCDDAAAGAVKVRSGKWEGLVGRGGGESEKWEVRSEKGLWGEGGESGKGLRGEGD